MDRSGGRTTAESVLSGPGIVRLYRAVARRLGTPASCQTPGEVIAAEAAGRDRAASEAIGLFASLLGRFAGDLALVFGASGGVFLGSGIPRRIVGILNHGQFRAAFERKAPFEKLMRKIPTFVITHPEPGMLGLALIAGNPAPFIFEAQEWIAPR